MISENVLPAKYQQLITGEINRILREMNRPIASDDKNREEHKQWNSLPRSIEETSQWQSLSRHKSESDRSLSLRQDSTFESSSLSRKGSNIDSIDFEDFPNKGYYR